MSVIKRKLLVEEKPEKSKVEGPKPKKVKKSLKVESLPDAVVEGKLVAEVGSELIASRYKDGKDRLVVLTLKKVDEDGLVHAWDETAQQWFNFNLNQTIPKILKMSL